MGIESTAVLTNLKTKVRKEFAQTMTTAATWWDKEGKGVMTELPSNFAMETFGWLAEMSGMREWIGSREIDRVRERSYQAATKKYEKTVAVNADKLEDQGSVEEAIVTAGTISSAIAEVTAQLPDDLYVYTLQNGQSIVCYDGQNLYDTDHPQKLDGSAGTQSNYEASGFALTQPNFLTAIARLRSFKGEAGRPRGTGKKVVLEVPPALEGTGKTILVALTIATGGTNISQGMAELRVNPLLAGQDTTWYLHLVDGPGVGALVRLKRRAARMVVKASAQDENVFWDNEVVFGSDARESVIPGAWFKTFKAAA